MRFHTSPERWPGRCPGVLPKWVRCCEGLKSNEWKHQQTNRCSTMALTSKAPLLSTANETMADLKIGRARLYELINSGELESFTCGRSRKILEASKQAYVQRSLEAERQRRAARTVTN